jgi:hypothetical protein
MILDHCQKNVVIKGTTRGVATDFDGKFALNARQGDVFDFIGYNRKEITGWSANKLYIQLKDSNVIWMKL